MRDKLRTGLTLLLLVGAPAAAADSVELEAIQFPEKLDVHVPLQATPVGPTARVVADVSYRNGQARIELSYEYMKPAILYGGDVTCFVLWAVTRDGQAENLGEFVTRKRSGRLEFSTGKKSFALMVTAESFYLVGRPSSLVAFRNGPPAQGDVSAGKFRFEQLAPAPRHHMDGIAHIKWDSKVPLELLQARKAFELAGGKDAATHAPQIYADARAALDAANGSDPKSRELLDAARRAVALSNEALNISVHRMEAIELERAVERRRAETEALEARAAEAEEMARRAEGLAARVRLEADQVRAEKERMVAESVALQGELSEMEGSLAAMRQEKLQIEQDSQRLAQEKTVLELEARQLQTEKAELAGRLQAALSHVADTEESVRGFVVNLPDILFDLDKASLKPEAQVVLAKLAGILLVMPDRGVLIEGHTDATGSPEYNLDLSQRRAGAVLEFLRSQGLDSVRLQAIGYGMQRPVADNGTAEGRKRNRRVEIVIGEPQPDEVRASG